MKLLVAILGRDDASTAVEALTRERLSATLVNARGGFLREGVAAILAGLDDQAVSHALAILRRHCQRRTTMLPDELRGMAQDWPFPVPEDVEVETGGATVFILNVVRFERF
jgi:uncharacterized protein YaaQ